MMTEEQIIARLQAARLDRPRQPAPPPKPEVKAQERWTKQPTEAVIQSATLGNDALARRMEQERKELAQGEDVRQRYQRELDRWWQSKLDAEASLDDGYDYSTGYQERRYKSTCHRGPGDSDWGLR